MSLTAKVTKTNVTNNQPGLYSISLELVITDTEGVGFTKTYSHDYRTGENVATKKQLFISDMQDDIDKYKLAKTLSGATALATAVTDIQNSLSL